MVVGVATRLAVKMGYHRDPSHFNISPFEGEMRRRTFFVVEAMDILLSFQAGLHPILQEQNCDTGPPLNILDADFDENCETLPPSRPATDPTPMLYCSCKRQQVKFLRRICGHALSFETPCYEETMKLDGELHKIHRDIPACVRIQPLCSSFLENTQTVMIRLNIELLHLRSICVLHRRYLSHEKSNPTYNYSRKICTDSALQILKYEAEIHWSCQPGGQFYHERWITSSLVLYDFLLSAMIICLDLYESRNKIATASLKELEIQTRKHDALHQSHVIWKSRRGITKDAQRASSILAVMLSKVPSPSTPSTLQTHLAPDEGYISTNGSNGLQSPGAPYIATEPEPQAQRLPNGIPTSNFNSVDPLNAIFSESDPIDWVRS